MIDLEDEGTVTAQSAWNYLPNDTSSYPIRLEASDCNWINRGCYTTFGVMWQ